MNRTNCITITTDASFKKGRAGSFAYWIKCDLFEIKNCGIFKSIPRTIQDAEIMAIGNAFAMLLQIRPEICSRWIVINTDSQTAIDKIPAGIDEPAKAVKALSDAVAKKYGFPRIDFRHVKAHSGKEKRNRANQWCDQRAKEQLGKALKQ